MSVLQEILEKGFVDPEVLTQLGEEQKQILFIKMREEQLRKWRQREAELERQENEEEMLEKKNGAKNCDTTRRVEWLNGRDGNVWVWVMGEHPDDMSIEQILEMESKEKARRLAEKEIMQTLRKAEDLPNALENNNKREERALKAELARMELNVPNGKMANEFGGKSDSHSPYDELDGSGSLDGPGTSLDEFVGPILRFGHQTFAGGDSQQPQQIYDNLTNLPPPLPQTNHSPTVPPPFLRQFPNKAKPTTINGAIINGGGMMPSSSSKPPPPVPEKPPSLRRTVSSNSNGLLLGEQIPFNTIRSYIPSEEVQKRQSKIFEQLKEERERLEREADAESRRQEAEYEERERKAKEADEAIRRTVQRAREQHRKNLRTSDSLLPLFRNNPNGSVESVRDALRALPRPPKPRNRLAIIQWFQETEMAQWRGLAPPKWFHGIISREEAERLLQSKSIGAFLVRVTERIFGYTVSYRAEEGTKNFLVERIADGYQFMGTNQLVHSTLVDLIVHHQIHPITTKGGEILREPIGQEKTPRDYEELFQRDRS